MAKVCYLFLDLCLFFFINLVRFSLFNYQLHYFIIQTTCVLQVKSWLIRKNYFKESSYLFLCMVLHLTRLLLILSTERSDTSAFMIRLIHTSLLIWMGTLLTLNNSCGWLQRLSRLISCHVHRKYLL